MAEPTAKELYEKRREEEKKERGGTPSVAATSSGGGRKFLWWIVALLILLGIGYLLYTEVKKEIPKTPDQSVGLEILSRDHIPVGSPRPEYNSNPPTSGPHYDTPAAVGFYPDTLPDEQLVHNLEHGDVWVSFKGSLSSSTVEELKTLLDGVKVIITRRDANDTDVAAVTWGRLEKFNLAGAAISADELQRLRDFILRYKNRGPESVIDSASMLGQ